ncbi:MAG: FtsX-like permease family protein, partial [Gemmatimonadaceae bacterium]
FFDFFDARPVMGRVFVSSEDVTPRGADVAVLSYEYWQSEFGKRNVIGEHIRVGNVNAAIIGVLPRGFRGVGDADPPVLYIPITTYAASTGTDDSKTYYSKNSWGWINILARRKASVSLAQAQADASLAFTRSWKEARVEDSGFPSVEVAKPVAILGSPRPGAGPNPGLQARVAIWILIVAIVVLLIAIANVANLFLSRALQRKRETAVRLALGVSRSRLVLQSMTESLLLALAGGCAALLVAQWAGAGIRQMLIARNANAEVFTDWRTLSATVVLAIAAGVAVGAIPALFLGRGNLAQTLRGGARGGNAEGARVRGALLVMQATFSVVLLVAAALFVKSLNAVRSLPMGYTTEHVLEVSRVIRGTIFNDSAQIGMRRMLLETAQSLPGVESAAWVSSMPFTSTSSADLFVTGIDSVSRLGNFTYQATTPDYFRTMGTRILRGRGLANEDQYGAPNIAVVSESMAKALWPGKDAVGQCLRVRADTMPCTTVVGVAEDMVQRDIVGGTRFHYYLSADQFKRTWGFGMVLKLRGDPEKEKENIRKALQHVMPGSSYITVETLRSVVEGEQSAWRMGATMFLAFGALALIVAAIGLYGVIGYNVTQRMHELGVRVALGAQSSNILRLVVGQSVRFALAGVVLGVLISCGIAQRIQPLLFQQSARDPFVFIGVSIVMIVVAFGASALPALRASKADPN